MNPSLRLPRQEMVIDWTAMASLTRSEIVAIEKGRRLPPVVPGKVRRTGRRVVNVKGRLTRQARRLAWKIERRTTGTKVQWRESRAASGALAPVIPLHRRGHLARIRASLPPLGRRGGGGNLMEGAA